MNKSQFFVVFVVGLWLGSRMPAAKRRVELASKHFKDSITAKIVEASAVVVSEVIFDQINGAVLESKALYDEERYVKAVSKRRRNHGAVN